MSHLYNAALTHYKSQELEALAVLDLYFNNLVAIPDHSDVLKEITIWTEKLSAAKGNLKTLEEMIQTPPEEEPAAQE